MNKTVRFNEDPKKTDTAKWLGHRVLFAAALLGTGLSSPSHGNTISQTPLFLTPPVDPNVLFIIDDSGSMQWETMPDELTARFGSGINSDYVMWTYPRVRNLHGGSPQYSNRRVARFSDGSMAALYRSPQHNTVYYDPSTTYKPWTRPDGSIMDDATPSAAPNRPGFSTFGERDLTSWNREWARWLNDNGGHSSGEKWFWPATYYYYTGGPIDDRSSYEFTQIHSGNESYSGHGRESRIDCDDGVCTYDQEIQNFANWYTYHRNRIFASRAGIGAAFAEQGEDLRVGYGTINDGIVHGVRQFQGGNRTTFFDELYERDVPAAGTPLRPALRAAGDYFSRTDSRGPWSSTPGEWGGEDLACRQSYTILMSDGYWNGSLTGFGNVDGSGQGELISNPEGETFRYEPIAPFEDSHSNTLADVAMYYWHKDLRPDLPNQVPTSSINPAFWQHMVTFTVGLAVEGEVSPEEAFAAIETGESIEWPNPHGNVTTPKIDDMLHAAVNARGGFFSAMDAETFSRELSDVLQDIATRSGASVTSLATNSTEIRPDELNLVYQARFNSANWSGDLVALEIDAATLELSEVWSAAEQLPAPGATNAQAGTRNLYTFDGNGGIAFEWTPLEAAGLGDKIGGEEVLLYLRGNTNNELRNDGSFRNRSTPLGDIVNSNPVFQGRNLNYGYQAMDEYENFLQDNQSRREVVYVGSNSGMLHAFDAETGEELFGYVPGMLLGQLPDLTAPDYSHRFFVDGQQTLAHVRIGGDWRTVLVGTLGAGGRGAYALDVTDPADFSEENVLWEISSDEHENLGYTFGEATVGRTADDNWTAFLGNGYGSQSGAASLFAVNVSNGNVREIELDEGNDNGLSSPVFRTGDDRQLRTAFAGDLLGNIWEIDLSRSNANQWDSPYGQGNNTEPLFTAQGPDGEVQPITAKPGLGRHPLGGLIVLFGTGQYFAEEDNQLGDSPDVQSFYGIRVHDGTDDARPLTRDDDLLRQEIIGQGTLFGTPWRATTDETIENDHEGWYLDLFYGTPKGERVLTQPLLLDGMVFFVTQIPSDDPCVGGGTSALFALNAASGARPDAPTFDLSGAGEFGDLDMVTQDGELIAPSAIGLDIGLAGRPTAFRTDTGRTVLGLSGTDGEDFIDVSGGSEDEDSDQYTRSWRQLR